MLRKRRLKTRASRRFEIGNDQMFRALLAECEQGFFVS